MDQYDGTTDPGENMDVYTTQMNHVHIWWLGLMSSVLGITEGRSPQLVHKASSKFHQLFWHPYI